MTDPGRPRLAGGEESVMTGGGRKLVGWLVVCDHKWLVEEKKVGLYTRKTSGCRKGTTKDWWRLDTTNPQVLKHER